MERRTGGSGAAEDLPGADTYISVPQATAAAWTSVTWAGANDDDGPCWAAGNPTRLTAPSAGKYIIEGCGTWYPAGGNPAAVMGVRLLLNGVTPLAYGYEYAGAFPAHCVTRRKYLNAGDYIELQAYDGFAGATLKVDGTHLSIQKVSE